MFQFYLDNTLVSDPINWKDFTETIERDDIIKGLLPKYEQKLTFNAGGYKYLFDLKKSGFCQLVEIKINQKCSPSSGYEQIFTGYIFLSDCKFNYNKCTVECSIEDDNFGARIYNNKSILLYLDGRLTKNGASITPCTTALVTCFIPATGLDVALPKRKVYPVWDCFNYIINFISDGKIDFESDFLNKSLTHTGNPQRKLSITTGAILRNVGNLISPLVSFQDLFSNINKKYPLGFTILRQSNGRPLIKIENESYFYGSPSNLTINNIQDLFVSINTELLYSEISIGGTTAKYDSSIHSVPDDYRMFFKNESYYFTTECNIDKKLDLVTNYISDSNIIEELVDTNTTNDSYDENVFFLEVTYSSGITGNVALKTSLLVSSATPYYYNSNLKNENVSKRFSFYSDLVQFINSNDIGFQATSTSNYIYPAHNTGDYTFTSLGYINPLYSTTILLQYQDDVNAPNHDAGNNFTSNSRYTSTTDGYYYFFARLKLGIYSSLYTNLNIMINFYLEFRHYDSAGVLIDTYVKNIGANEFYGYKVFTKNSIINMDGDKSFFLEAGDYVESYFYWVSVPYGTYDAAGKYYGLPPTSGQVAILSGSYFKTISTASNGTLALGNSLNYNVERIEFDYPISNSFYNSLKLDLSKSLEINNDGIDNKKAWIRKSVRNYATGETKFELISNINNSL